ncbi:hypothetical protein HS7_05550 [Sulfolobales archaeon HS-7]|nr:hypothetical protein HS7_05550 [Sulfolobales archaeon HS-7]
MEVLLDKEIKDPYLNIAIDYSLVRIATPPLLRIWINDKSVVLGVMSAITDEVHLSYVNKAKIKLVRRFSGGGTVYHDNGVLNYSVITFCSDYDVNKLYANLLQGIVNAFHSLGIKTEIRNDTDIVYSNKKICGNSAYLSGKKCLLHGSILLNADINEMYKSLVIPPRKVRQNIDMVKYRPANLTDFIRVNREQLIDKIISSYSSWFGEGYQIRTYHEQEMYLANEYVEKFKSNKFIFSRI